MLSDLLKTIASDWKILLQEEDYILARVEIDGKSMLAEISVGYSGGIPPSRWPRVSGVLHADSEMFPTAVEGARILLFSIPKGSEVYLEKIRRGGALSEIDAINVGRRMLGILRRLHDAGYRAGYLGPENVLVTPAGDHYILAGARGIPDTPFSPPEAVGSRAHDPRSDVYALGLLMFRLIAGSDAPSVQVDAWNKLSEGMLRLLEGMISPEVDDRYANLVILSRKMSTVKPEVRKGFSEKETEHGRSSRKKEKKTSPWVWIVIVFGITAALAAAWLVFGAGRKAEETPSVVETTIPEVPADTSEAGCRPADTVETAALPVEPVVFEPVIWVSNCTGMPGVASRFRQGPAADFSSVYACTGSRRNNSILLARRPEPRGSLEDYAKLSAVAADLVSGDTSMTVLPVDLTILLGDDLTGGLAPGTGGTSGSPAGTLYVDVVNHGVEGSFNGMGAATWTGSVLENGYLDIDGEKWVVEVVDIRNGDRLNDELGIPRELDSTLFLYKRDVEVLKSAEEEIRRIFRLPRNDGSSHPPDPPDLWVLLAR